MSNCKKYEKKIRELADFMHKEHKDIKADHFFTVLKHIILVASNNNCILPVHFMRAHNVVTKYYCNTIKKIKSLIISLNEKRKPKGLLKILEEELKWFVSGEMQYD